MKLITYEGPATFRLLGPDDGLDTARTFTAGEPQEVSDADARRILDLLPREFTQGQPPEAAEPSSDEDEDDTDEED